MLVIFSLVKRNKPIQWSMEHSINKVGGDKSFSFYTKNAIKVILQVFEAFNIETIEQHICFNHL